MSDVFKLADDLPKMETDEDEENTEQITSPIRLYFAGCRTVN